MMSDRTKIEILREEVTIPQIVRNKADKAYATIREQEGQNEVVWPGQETKGLHKIRMGRRLVILAAAVVMLLAGMVVGACVRWSAGMSEKWQVEEEQKEKLLEVGAAAFAMQSQTQNGITITAEQSLADCYSVYLAFRVDGYTERKGLSPDFEEIRVHVDGVEDVNYSAGFYDGTATGEDGSMSYCISMTRPERGWALGKDIHVELTNLCGYEDSTGEAVRDSGVNGTWRFDWNLQGTENSREWTGEMPLGDSGAVVCRVELSPISGYVEYDWPRKREVRYAVGADGEPVEIARWVRAPRMSGVRLEDGTEYPDLFSGDGSEGYLSSGQESTGYYACRGNGRVIDPDKVVSLLFENTADGGFYEIPFETKPVQ